MNLFSVHGASQVTDYLFTSDLHFACIAFDGVDRLVSAVFGDFVFFVGFVAPCNPCWLCCQGVFIESVIAVDAS